MRFLFTLHQLVNAWRKFANSTSKGIMLRCNRYSGVQQHLFIQKKSPIRKLESCESRFLWKNGSFSPTTWKTSGTRITDREPLN